VGSVTTTDRERDDLVDALQQRVEESAPELAAALSELAGLLLDSEPLDATLRRVADLAVQALPGCTAGGVTLLDAGGRPRTAAATDPLTLAVDQQQYDEGDGPCLDAARHLRVNRVDLGEAEQRWPAFAERARGLGVRSYLAAPLVVQGSALGSLNLYSRSTDGFDALDDALVSLFCAQASVAVANADVYERAVRLSEQMQVAMASRAEIEQAKGVLMCRHGIDADAAFGALRERSQAENRKLRDVALDVIAEVSGSG
jgi:GAF domain-containing protein